MSIDKGQNCIAWLLTGTCIACFNFNDAAAAWLWIKRKVEGSLYHECDCKVE